MIHLTWFYAYDKWQFIEIETNNFVWFFSLFLSLHFFGLSEKKQHMRPRKCPIEKKKKKIMPHIKYLTWIWANLIVYFFHIQNVWKDSFEMIVFFDTIISVILVKSFDSKRKQFSYGWFPKYISLVLLEWSSCNRNIAFEKVNELRSPGL